MKNKLKAVKKFHEAFGLGINHKPIAKLSKGKLKLRFDLMAEENEEYLEAAKDDDLVEVADALGDVDQDRWTAVDRHPGHRQVDDDEDSPDDLLADLEPTPDVRWMDLLLRPIRVDHVEGIEARPLPSCCRRHGGEFRVAAELVVFDGFALGRQTGLVGVADRRPEVGDELHAALALELRLPGNHRGVGRTALRHRLVDLVDATTLNPELVRQVCI